MQKQTANVSSPRHFQPATLRQLTELHSNSPEILVSCRFGQFQDPKTVKNKTSILWITTCGIFTVWNPARRGWRITFGGRWGPLSLLCGRSSSSIERLRPWWLSAWHTYHRCHALPPSMVAVCCAKSCRFPMDWVGSCARGRQGPARGVCAWCSWPSVCALVPSMRVCVCVV